MWLQMRLTLKLLTGRNPLVFVHNEASWPRLLLKDILDNCVVKNEFISEKEEKTLLEEVEPHMKRLRYEKNHWDDAIYLFREREQRRWNTQNESILKRIMEESFPQDALHLGYIHILDLHKDGHIKPHIDSVRYCGSTISGVSLLSDSVMRLRHKDDEHTLIVDLMLMRRSLYKLTGIGRYDFKHEILGNEESLFDGKKVEKDRRISVICRDMPVKNQESTRLEHKPVE